MFGSGKPRGPVKAAVPAGRQPLEHRNNQLIESPTVWLADKARDDNARLGVPPNLWCVAGKLYDLSSFAKRHPGGAQWIEMTRGSDITELVVTHHLNDAAVAAVLRKTVAGDAPKKNSAPPRFTFAKDGFYATLKRRAAKVLGTEMKGHGPTESMRAVCWTLLLSYGLTFATMCLAPTVTASVACLLAAFLLHALMGVGHNFFHQADTPWRFCFDLSLFNSYDWRVTHAVSHHTYANLELDTEVSSVEPWMYFLTNKPRNSVMVYITFQVFLAFASTLDWVRHYVGALRGKHRLRPEDALNWVQAALLVGSRGWRGGMAMFMVMHAVSCWQLTTFSFGVHRTEHCWTEGDAEPQMDFGRHIVASTAEHSVQAGLMQSFLFYAGFNYHILHHMFPTVDHSRLHSLDSVFKQTLSDFGMQYRSYSFLQLYSAVFRRHDMPLIAKLIPAAPVAQPAARPAARN